MASLDPASSSFKNLLGRVVNDTLQAIPFKLLDHELGIAEPSSTSGPPAGAAQQADETEQPVDTDQAQQAQHADQSEQLVDTKQAQQAKQADQAEQPMDTEQAQQAEQSQQATHEDEWNFDDGGAGHLRLPLFTSKVMAFVQYLLQYKVWQAVQ